MGGERKRGRDSRRKVWKEGGTGGGVIGGGRDGRREGKEGGNELLLDFSFPFDT